MWIFLRMGQAFLFLEWLSSAKELCDFYRPLKYSAWYFTVWLLLWSIGNETKLVYEIKCIHLFGPKTNLVKNNEIRRLPLQNEYAYKHYI